MLLVSRSVILTSIMLSSVNESYHQMVDHTILWNQYLLQTSESLM